MKNVYQETANMLDAHSYVKKTQNKTNMQQPPQTGCLKKNTLKQLLRVREMP